jgi:hypothetical protein
MFYESDPQDRVLAMLRIEQFRRRYRPTKTTTKMLFAVNFSSQPLDHFLSSDNPQQDVGERVVVHDPSQWSGQTPPPPHVIRAAEHLHRALHVIQDAAAVWYPEPLASVFRAVHGDAIHSVRYGAPTQVVNAMCNLYSAVFAALFNHILAGVDLRDLEGLATQMMRRSSPEYQQFVGDVLNTAMMHSAFQRTPAQRGPATGNTQRTQGAGRQHQGVRQGAVPRRADNDGQAVARVPQQPVLPPNIRSQVPTRGGKEFCMRFQTMVDCDFVRCPRIHELVQIPQTVIEWVEGKHGSLKSDHPSFL